MCSSPRRFLFPARSRPGGACFVLCRRAIAVLSGYELYILLCCQGDVLSFDFRALHGKIALCCGEVCFFPCSDFAACIFPCDALGAAVGFARAKAEVQGESCGIFQRVLSLAEVFVDEATGFPCVDGFQAVVFHFAHALQRCGDLLSEAQVFYIVPSFIIRRFPGKFSSCVNTIVHLNVLFVI